MALEFRGESEKSEQDDDDEFHLVSPRWIAMRSKADGEWRARIVAADGG